MEKENTKSQLSRNTLLFPLLLVFSNLLTLFVATNFNTSCSLKPNLEALTTAITSTAAAAAAAANRPIATSGNYVVSQTTPAPFNPDDFAPEFIAFTSPQKLPLGVNPNFNSDQMLTPVGSPCTMFKEELRRYMTYTVNGSCPDDESLAQKLLLLGCEPLPRRRCRPASPSDYVEPYPLPDSLWTTPPDSSVVWTAYYCKNYYCLINRSKTQKGFDDCKDCFDLNGPEKVRWTGEIFSNLDFSIDEVLGAKPPGTIRIGLDIGGGVATFAVRMRQRNVTIVTTTMNLNGPFNNFIAARGVIPLYVSISQRLPFFDNTLDIVHSMHVLSNWIPADVLHFMLFDIYRVLRPGGLFWLDRFFCVGDQLWRVYAPLIESVGFVKVRWEVGRKLDRGPELNEMYLSALLEKPLKNSW